MDCRLTRKHLSAYVDGELEPSPMLELEEHIVACAPCADEHKLASAIKGEVKKQLHAPAAPAHLRAQVMDALAGVQVEADERHGSSHVGMTLAAVAAALMLVFGSVIGSDAGPSPQVAGMTPALGIVRDVVNRHKDELPTEVATEVPAQATSWFRGKLSFRAEPVVFNEPTVHFVGGRISQVGEHQAAKLYYAVGGSRLTLVMFKPSPQVLDALRSERELQKLGGRHVRVGDRDLTYHTLQGYTVPIIEQNGIVYAFAGDLDQSSLLKLVATARIPH